MYLQMQTHLTSTTMPIRTRSEYPADIHEQIVIPRKGVTVAGVGR
jgi:hypothetical protein